MRSRAVVLCSLLVFVVVQGAATPAGADTASDLAAARQKVADAQAAADASAAAQSNAEGRYEELQQRITALENVIQAAQARAAVLQSFVRQRAVAAYTQHGNTKLDVMFSADSPLDAARRAELLDHANQDDNLAVKKLAAVRADLSTQEKEAQQQRDEAQQVKDQLQAKNAAIQSNLAAASAARDQLAALLEREQANAAAAAELARLRAVQAASQAAPSNGGGGQNVSAGQVIANPGGGSFQCPVVGSAYTDSYGPRGGGFHYGIDMLAPTGVPEVAVKAGTVSYMAMDGDGGNEGYLAADDGNVYYYAHMSQFVGGPRAVAQGEVIGLVGSTGDATAPHLHFEIRIGGANGQKIDPYPTLKAAGC